jgi:hypothetical protein
VSGLFAGKFFVVCFASDISTFNIQVVFASELILSGASFNSSFTAVTLPETGANKSDTAFTDSTEPKLFPASIVSPTFGRSTNTMSPSEFCA